LLLGFASVWLRSWRHGEILILPCHSDFLSLLPKVAQRSLASLAQQLIKCEQLTSALQKKKSTIQFCKNMD